MPNKLQDITIYNVAKTAGVSISTVSRVVNELGRVAPDTRRKVELAIRNLNFRPNSRAQALSRKRTDTIGLIVPDFEGQYFSMLMEGAHSEAKARGVHIMVLKAKEMEDKIEAVTRLCSEGRTDGVILMLSELYNEVLEAIGPINRPLVVLDRDVNSWRLDNILLDNRLGSFEATEHFINIHGRTDLFFLGGSENNVDTIERALGFNDALRPTGKDTANRQFFCKSYSYEEGYRMTSKEILPLIKPENHYGILAGNDDIACSAIDALIDNGIKVPENVGVIGFDDSDIASHRRLKVTTMQVPTMEIGKTAVKTIMDRLANKTSEPVKMVLKAKLIIRQSCGCNMKQY